MNTNIDSFKANIIKHPYISLIRKNSKVNPNIYELDTLSLCKLVDSLSAGGFIQNSAYVLVGTDVLIDRAKTFHCMCDFLSKNLSAEHVKTIFGDITLASPEDYELYIAQCDTVRNEDSDNIIKNFILSKYDICPGGDSEGECKLVRKENAAYKNY